MREERKRESEGRGREDNLWKRGRERGYKEERLTDRERGRDSEIVFTVARYVRKSSLSCLIVAVN